MQKIYPIELGFVNCFLVQGEGGFVLIDTGMSFHRKKVQQALEKAGCQPGDLKLVILTHPDADHIGGASYFQKQYGAKVAIHPLDAPGAISGNAADARKSVAASGRLVMKIMGLFVVTKCQPDVLLEEGSDLSGYGVDLQVLHLPGHSQGSIGLLTPEGELFCGDLMTNDKEPGPSGIVDEANVMMASIERVKTLPVKVIYPGHGKPFSLDELAS